MFDMNTKVSELTNTPIGKDLIDQICLHSGLSENILINPVTRRLPVKALVAMTAGMVDAETVRSLIDLLNQEQVEEVDFQKDNEITPTWWKEAVAYQIYPISFKDSNGDGIGDLGGIIERLDYLADLGVNLLWLSPVYDSPNADNGYDIRDYYEIMERYGSMEDMDRLVDETHKRGMRLIMDLVVNHTSDEHPWFKSAVQSKDSQYRDYYIWRDNSTGKRPNNWTSFFSGSTWRYSKATESYYLHLFTDKQPDLNWEHEPMRKDIYQMMNFWLEKGIDGFRMDVINFISKVDGLPDGSELIGNLMGHCGVEHYFYGPRLHEYLMEMRQETFDRYDCVTVGETQGIGINMAKMLSDESRQELDMLFNFDHMSNPSKSKWETRYYNLNHLKKVFMKWQTQLSNGCWPTVFIDNHDNPRMVSKIDPTGRYSDKISKMLAMLQLTLKGTPFIYQGQEIGMVNGEFSSIEDFEDVESINFYNDLILDGMDKNEAFEMVATGSRDHARLVMPWTDGLYHGFSTVQPWLRAEQSKKNISVEKSLLDEKSVYHFFKELINLRKTNKELIYGDIEFIHQKEKDYLAYYRNGERSFFIEMNLGKTHKFAKGSDYELIMCNYNKPSAFLHQYECRLYRVNR